MNHNKQPNIYIYIYIASFAEGRQLRVNELPSNPSGRRAEAE